MRSIDAIGERVRERASLTPELDAGVAVLVVMESLLARLTSGEGHRLIHALPRSLRVPLGHLLLERDGRPIDGSSRAEMLANVADALSLTPARGELVCETVFESMREALPSSVIDSVAHQLPRDIRALWLASAPATGGRAPSLENGRSALRSLEAELLRRVEPPAGVTAPKMFSAVLSTLLRRLSGGEARHLFLSLPQSIRPLVTATMIERTEAPSAIDKQEFLRRVGERLGVSRELAETISREVLALVRDTIPELEVNDITSQLPRSMADLWPGAVPAVRRG